MPSFFTGMHKKMNVTLNTEMPCARTSWIRYINFFPKYSSLTDPATRVLVMGAQLMQLASSKDRMPEPTAPSAYNWFELRDFLLVDRLLYESGKF